MGERKCLYPGSFDPVTNGHMDIIERASKLFDEVIVAVMVNIAKKGCFSVEERVELLKKACAGLSNVRIISFSGLTVQLAHEMDAHIMVRGVRNMADMDSELTLARANRAVAPDIETLLLPASPDKEVISASIVREIASFGGDISPFVPSAVVKAVTEHFKT